MNNQEVNKTVFLTLVLSIRVKNSLNFKSFKCHTPTKWCIANFTEPGTAQPHLIYEMFQRNESEKNLTVMLK